MTTTAIQRRELAQRTNHGIEVALFWSESNNRVTIEITDTRLEELIEFEVAGADALDAFYHPYAYAFARRPGVRFAIAEAVAT
jgi:hypothetical protein